MTARTDSRPLLRQEVASLRERENRRTFDPILFVGELGGSRHSFVVRQQDVLAIDRAIRIEVVAALLEDAADTPGTAWLARSGHPEPRDTDLDWMAASAAAWSIHGRSLEGFYVLTRFGWRDVRTGASETLRRGTWRRGGSGPDVR